MYVGTQSLSHLSSTNIRNCMQCKAIVQLIMIQKILLDAVHYQMKEFVFLIEEQCYRQVPNLLL